MGTIMVGDKEQRRAQILTRLLTGQLSMHEAQALLGVSPRHLRRLRQRFAHSGVAALVHGNTGRVPRHKTPPEVTEQIRLLCGPGGPYHRFNTCHTSELLRERHNLILGRSTLSRLLKQLGLVTAGATKQERRHERRERHGAEGSLLQIDGSPHAWLEARGPRLCLLGAIDDATSRVVYLRFHPSESQDGYLRLVRAVAQTHGLPMAFYHDRHTILRSPKQATLDEELAGKGPHSQVQRVLGELGVESIAALSPQAKGRVERLWQTLQDRLVKEMRLAGISTMEQANDFLPAFLVAFNARFMQAPRESEALWVALPEGFDAVRHFSTQAMRLVKADQSLSFLGRVLVVTEGRSYAGERVAVHVTPEGEVALYQGKRRLSCREGSKSVPPVKAPARPTDTAKKAPNPAKPTDPEAVRARNAWLHGKEIRAAGGQSQ